MNAGTHTRPEGAYHHGELERAARDLAIDMVREQGAAGVSMRALAARVGVTHGALYRHFPDRAALMASVAAHGYRLLAACLVGVTETGAGVGDPSRAFVRAYAGFALVEPRLHDVMMAHDAAAIRAHDELSGAVDAVTNLCLSAFSGIDPVDARDRVIAAWSLATGAISLWRAGLIHAADEAGFLAYLDRLADGA